MEYEDVSLKELTVPSVSATHFPPLAMTTWAHFLATAFIFASHLLSLSLCRIQADQLPYKSDALLSLSEITDIAGDGKGTSRHTFRQSAKESMSQKDIVKLDRVSPTQLDRKSVV